MSETASIAFDDLRWLHRFARLMALNSHDADDLVQDTLITAWQRPPAEREDVRPWLGMVLRNHLRMRRRGDARRGRRESEHAPDPRATPAPDRELARVSVLRHLVAELEQLPPQDQQLIVRRFFEGHSAADIGRALDIPAATIRSRISRSLERLRLRLDARCDGRDAWCAAVVAIPIPGAATVLAKPTKGHSMMIKATIVSVAVGGTAAGVVAVGSNDSPAQRVVAATDSGVVTVGSKDSPAPRVMAAPDSSDTTSDPQAQWATRRDAIRNVLDAEPPAAGAPTPKHHRVGYAKLILACVKDLQDVPAQLSVKLTEIGAPDVGTIVTAAEVVATSIDNPAVTECVEQSMYAYIGDPPETAYERSYRFGVVLPGKKFTPAILDMMFTQLMANRYLQVRRCEPEGVKGEIEVELTIGSDGTTEKVAIVDTTVDAPIGKCLVEAAATWNFMKELAGPRRYRYTLPVQPPVVRRE